MAQWNPPPPNPLPELSCPQAPEDSTLSFTSDAIGDTVFSKAWVLSLLVKAVEAVHCHEKTSGSPEMIIRESESKHPGVTVMDDDTQTAGRSCVPGSSEQPLLGGSGGDVEQQQEEKGAGDLEERSREVGEETAEGGSQEISESLENDLCRLWDASMNPDMALFLHEQHALGLLLGVASRTTAPRLTNLRVEAWVRGFPYCSMQPLPQSQEICIGILGNMACVEKVCEERFCDSTQIQQLLMFLGSSDSPTLFEATRLTHTCLSHEAVQPVWLAEIRQATHILRDLTFILQSSTNEELLRNVAVLLDRVLDCDSQLLEEWSSREFVEAICEAMQQTRLSSFDATCTFVMTLQLLSTVESGVPFLVECEEQVCTLLCDFLLSFENPDDSLSIHLSFVVAALSLLVILTENSSSERVKEHLNAKDIQQLLHSFLEYSSPNYKISKMARRTQEELHTSNKCTSNSADSGGDSSKASSNSGTAVPSGRQSSSADVMTLPHDCNRQDSSNSLHLLVHKLLKYSNSPSSDFN